MQRTSEIFTIQRGTVQIAVLGTRFHDKRVIIFLPDVDVRKYDVLTGTRSGARFSIIEVTDNALEGVVVQRTAHYRMTKWILNIQYHLDNAFHAIHRIARTHNATKADLELLVGELRKALKDEPTQHAEEIEDIVRRVEVLVTEAAQPQPDTTVVRVTSESLKKLTQNVTAAMPTVVLIASQIVDTIEHMLP